MRDLKKELLSKQSGYCWISDAQLEQLKHLGTAYPQLGKEFSDLIALVAMQRLQVHVQNPLKSPLAGRADSEPNAE
jgi:hypothetical protein